MTRRAARIGTPGKDTIVRLLREIWQGPAWHGPSLTKALQGVNARMAVWRPAPGRNSIWELVLHLALARHKVTERLLGERLERFPRPRRLAWFPVVPRVATEAAWRADRALLAQCHERLMQAVEHAGAARLSALRGRSRTIGFELLNMPVHDTWHAGQISLLKRLYRRRRRA